MFYLLDLCENENLVLLRFDVSSKTYSTKESEIYSNNHEPEVTNSNGKRPTDEHRAHVASETGSDIEPEATTSSTVLKDTLDLNVNIICNT